MTINWKALGQLLVNGIALGGGAFLTAMQAGAEPKAAGAVAGVAVGSAFVGLMQKKLKFTGSDAPAPE